MARILVVDDEVSHLSAMRRLLESAGHEVHLASDGEEALCAIFKQPDEEPFDLILLDLNMPGFDGRKFLDTTRGLRHLAKTSIFLVSGAADMQPEHAAVKLIFDKPVMFDRLLRTIEHFTRKTDPPPPPDSDPEPSR